LLLHYLPEFDLRTGEVLGAEALIRWQHPTRGLLLPDSFIDIIESSNLASKLGRFILRKACAQFSSWQQRGLGRSAVLNVNVSPALLVTHGIVDTVAATLGEFGIDPGAVCLEITERVVIEDIEATRTALGGLKEVGVQIAIDDFGTGYSALGYLKHLPVDTLKIDRGFVSDLGTNERDQAIVRSIMTFATAFNLEVVAEGVETADAARALIDLECYRAQGFLLSRPLAAADMEGLLARRAITVDFQQV
jgi:diguanylate cyclase